MDKIYLAHYYNNIYTNNRRNKISIKDISKNVYNNILISGYNGYIFGKLIYDAIDYNNIDKNLQIFFMKQFKNNTNITILCQKKQDKYYLDIQNFFNKTFGFTINFNIYHYDNAYSYYECLDNLINKCNFDLILQANKNRRKNKVRKSIFSFKRANIQIGEKLICTLNNEIVKVYNDKTKIIDKNSNIYSLSGYVTPIITQKINTERAKFSGIPYFEYNGKKIYELV